MSEDLARSIVTAALSASTPPGAVFQVKLGSAVALHIYSHTQRATRGFVLSEVSLKRKSQPAHKIRDSIFVSDVDDLIDTLLHRLQRQVLKRPSNNSFLVCLEGSPFTICRLKQTDRDQWLKSGVEKLRALLTGAKVVCLVQTG